MNKPILAMAAVMGLAIAQPGIAEGFRCGQRIATPDMTVEELLEACGEPTDKSRGNHRRLWAEYERRR